MRHSSFALPAPGRRACALAVALAASLAGAGAGAAADTRSPCDLSPASGTVPSQVENGTLALVAPRRVGLANWNVRWWQRHRVWVTLAADNRGPAQAVLLPELVVDPRADGGAAMLQVGQPLALAPHAGASLRMSAWIPDDAKALGMRVAAGTAGADVVLRFGLECSSARYDKGQVPASAAALLDPALRLYLGNYVDPLQSPNDAVEAVRLLATGAQDSLDVAQALRGMLRVVGDGLSFVLAPGETLPLAPPVPAQDPDFELRADRVAVLRLNPVGAPTAERALAWAATLHDAVATLAAQHPRGWIVDLRDFEGEPWPALAGLSPLLQGPTVGAFVSRSGRADWIVERGAVRLGGAAPLLDLQLPPEPMVTGPVAVLIGTNTAQAGGVVAIAFEGRPRTRFFGPAAAQSPNSGVRRHELSDGTVVGILETRAADRNGRIWRGPMEPDVVLAADVPADAFVQPALDWVLAEPSTDAGAR